MTDLNIDDFFKDVAKTLDLLYRNFPTPVTLFIEDISGADEPDEYGVHSARYRACLSTLLWLAAEGYLRYDSLIRTEALDQAVLTQQSFSRLCAVPLTSVLASATDLVAEQQPPSIREEQQTNIFLLRRRLKEKSSTELRTSVLALMQQMQSAQY